MNVCKRLTRKFKQVREKGNIIHQWMWGIRNLIFQDSSASYVKTGIACYTATAEAVTHIL